jgi:hypothetical protein
MTPTEEMVRVAAVIMQREVQCPWNPFPRNSQWGRKLDQMYRASLPAPTQLSTRMGSEKTAEG